MKRPLIWCPKCHGEHGGKVSLGDELFQTLEALEDLEEGTPADVTARLQLPEGNTAVNNRLEDLRGLGLVDRKKDPGNLRAFLYFLKRRNGKG